MSPAVSPTNPPNLPGYTWRPVRSDDAAALGAFQAECAEVNSTFADHVVDYQSALGPAGQPPIGDTHIAVDAAGRIAAIGWVHFDREVTHEHRVRLHGDVHPAYQQQGLGRFVLGWMEDRARQLLAERPADLPAILRIEFADSRPIAERLYMRQGFRRSFGELRMHRDLGQSLPQYPLPEGIQLVPWTTKRAGLFFATHEDAWSTRPKLQIWREDAWIAYWDGGNDFRADLSLLAVAGDEAAALILCEVDGVTREGWISKVGVRPRYRGRGLATALVSHALHTFRAAGLTTALLNVGDDNAVARRVYERLGFILVGHRVVYTKALDYAPPHSRGG